MEGFRFVFLVWPMAASWRVDCRIIRADYFWMISSEPWYLKRRSNPGTNLLSMHYSPISSLLNCWDLRGAEHGGITWWPYCFRYDYSFFFPIKHFRIPACIYRHRIFYLFQLSVFRVSDFVPYLVSPKCGRVGHLKPWAMTTPRASLHILCEDMGNNYFAILEQGRCIVYIKLLERNCKQWAASLVTWYCTRYVTYC